MKPAYVVQTAHKVSPLARRNDEHACRTNRYRGLQSFQQKRCYENSAMLIAEDDDQRLAYCEGYLRDSTVNVNRINDASWRQHGAFVTSP